MITKYRNLEPVGSPWKTFSYDDCTQEITLFDANGRGYSTYNSPPDVCKAWVVMSLSARSIALDIDADIALDEGL